MNSLEYENEKERLREERPVDMQFLSCNEAPHFFGHDMERASKQNLDYIPIVGEQKGLSFHCEINLYQEDSETFVCFRHISSRLKYGEFVSFDADGIPEEMLHEYKKRVLIMYRLLYPEGLTLDDMRHEN